MFISRRYSVILRVLQRCLTTAPRGKTVRLSGRTSQGDDQTWVPTALLTIVDGSSPVLSCPPPRSDKALLASTYWRPYSALPRTSSAFMLANPSPSPSPEPSIPGFLALLASAPQSDRQSCCTVYRWAVAEVRGAKSILDQRTRNLFLFQENKCFQTGRRWGRRVHLTGELCRD